MLNDEIKETVKFINRIIKKKNNLNMRIADKDTDTLFKSIGGDTIINDSDNNDENDGISPDDVLKSINLAPLNNILTDSDTSEKNNSDQEYEGPTDTSEHSNDNDASNKEKIIISLRSNRSAYYKMSITVIKGDDGSSNFQYSKLFPTRFKIGGVLPF